MAKKKVFKGVINGQEFDNVQEYNTRMSELIASGEDIEASSQTSIQDVEDVCSGEPYCDKCADTVEEFVNMLPGFNPRSTQGSFLNELVTDNPNLDEENFAKVRKYHSENYPKMVDKINHMDYHTAKGYLNDINVVLMEITDVDSDVKKSDNDIRARIASLEELLKDAERSHSVIEEYRNLYEELKSHVLSRIGDLNIKHPDDLTLLDNPDKGPNLKDLSSHIQDLLKHIEDRGHSNINIDVFDKLIKDIFNVD